MLRAKGIFRGGMVAYRCSCMTLSGCALQLLAIFAGMKTLKVRLELLLRGEAGHIQRTNETCIHFLWRLARAFQLTYSLEMSRRASETRAVISLTYERTALCMVMARVLESLLCLGRGRRRIKKR